MAEPLTDAYLQQCEWDARKFSGCWDQGTSGVLAAHVMRLLRELQQVKGKAAVERANCEEAKALYWWRCIAGN